MRMPSPGTPVDLTIVLALAFLALPGAAAGSAAPCDRTVASGQDIQGALYSLPDNGSHETVCLAPGEHRVSNMIVIERSHVTLRAQGDGATLRMEPGVSSPVLVIGDAHPREPQFRITEVTVEGLRIVGGGESDSEFYPHLPYLSNSAVVVRSGERIELRDLDVTDCRSACLLTEYASRGVTIEGNTVTNAVWDGISLNRAGATRVVDNVIRDNVAAGITVEHLKGGRISGNRIEGNDSHGIYLADAVDNVFRYNAFLSNHLAGVFLTCSIRYRDPVVCWPGSMSRGNLFEDNRFEGNRFAYQVGVDDVANCLDHDGPMNMVRGNAFMESRNKHPSRERYGDCLPNLADDLP